MKMRVRIVPSILASAERTGRIPESLAFGFAAYLLFMRGDVQSDRRRAGLNVPADDGAERLASAWKAAGSDHAALARTVCSDVTLWGTDLTAVPDFVDSVTDHLDALERDGAATALDAHLSAISSA
jgi:tagaturonate reductase